MFWGAPMEKKYGFKVSHCSCKILVIFPKLPGFLVIPVGGFLDFLRSPLLIRGISAETFGIF
jgi:hypothetical protein